MHFLQLLQLHNQTLWLTPERCIFWQENKILILSDLHLGKTGHFRKSGIAVPQDIYNNDLQRLFDQINFFKPKHVLIVGDMFHSNNNKEVDQFIKLRNDHADVEFILIRGNHDILSDESYDTAAIQVKEVHLQIGPFCFTHDIKSICDDDAEGYFFSGHIHPGIFLKGTAGQSLKLPCFYFSEKYAVLPAFSKFTGTSVIRPVKKDLVFALVENKIVPLQ
ncbi:ligase-associated DNA damage response endonuclease PdeM [soil metagenome]